MKKVLCRIRRNELHTLEVDVLPWEIPILRFIHKDQVEELHEVDVDGRVRDPQSEYERLERRYGRDKEPPHLPRVAAVYGVGPLGVQKLAEQMHSALKEQDELDAQVAAAEQAAAAAQDEAAKDDDAPEDRRSRRRSS